jgi:hypothetical protein
MTVSWMAALTAGLALVGNLREPGFRQPGLRFLGDCARGWASAGETPRTVWGRDFYAEGDNLVR